MIDDPLGNKTIASIDADYFRTLLPKTTAGRSALDAAASEIDREIANIEAEQRELLQQASRSSRTSMRAFNPDKDGNDPLAFLAGGVAGGLGVNSWDAVRNTINGYDQLAFSEKDRLYNEFLKQEAEHTGKPLADIKVATASTAPVEPSRSGLDLPMDILAGLGAGTVGMGKAAVDLIAPESDLSKSLGERIDTLNSMQSEVEQNNRKEIQAEIERFKAENPDANPLELFAAEMKATGGNLSVGTVSNLAGSMAAGMGAAGKVAKVVGVARGAAAGAAAGTAVGAGIEGVSTAGEVRGGVYEQVVNIPLSDPNLQANADFQKYLAKARGDVDPKGPGWSPLQEYKAQLAAREQLALDSRGAAALAGVAGAALSAFGPERAFAKAAANRAAAEATGSTVGLATRALDNALVKIPTSAAAEGLTEVAPTAATNINMQNVDPTRGALEGAGGDFVLGMLGGVGGEGASAALERATNLNARTPAPGAPTPVAGAPSTPAPGAAQSASPNLRITPVQTPEGTGYNVRQVDDTIINIPPGPDAQTEAELIAQQAQDEFDSLGAAPTTGAAPVTVDAFDTQLVMQPDGTMDYTQDAVRNAEADAFINQLRQQATGVPAPAAPAAPAPIPTPAGWDPQYATPEEMAAAARENRMPNAMPPPPGYTPTAPVVEPTPTPIAENLPEITLPEDVALPERAAPMAAPPAEIQVPDTPGPAAEDTPQRESAIEQARQLIVNQTVNSEFMSGNAAEITNRARSAGSPQAIHTLVNALSEADWLGYFNPRDALEAALTLDLAPATTPPGVLAAATAARNELQQRAVENVDIAANRQAAEIPLDRPTAEDLPAEVPTLTEAVAAPAVDANGIPVSGPLTQEQATEANNIINSNIFLDEIRDDIRLNLDPVAVMHLAENGNAFSPELSNLLRALNSAGWAGKATPAEAVRFAIGANEIPAEALSREAATSAQIIRARAIEYGRERSRERGIRRVLQNRVPQAAAARAASPATGTSQPGVEQAPSTPVDNLSLSTAAVNSFATAVQPLARNPLPAITPITGNATAERRVAAFGETLKQLLEPQGFTLPAVPGTYFTVRSPTGRSVSVSLTSRGNSYQVGTTTVGFDAGGSEGGKYYSALYAAAAAAGLPLYNGSYTSVNTTRLPINRLKAVLQTVGITGLSSTKVAKLLGMSRTNLGASGNGPLNTFNTMAQLVIKNAENYFPNATASHMADGRARSNYLTGVLRLNPDGTFDTPAGVMTAEELKNWTRVNSEGSPRYSNNESAGFGASSYSSMALAASLRSYMEATTAAQRQQVLQAIERISTDANRVHAFLDVTDPAETPGVNRRKSPAVGDVVTPSSRGYATVVKSLMEARRTGALPQKTVDLTLALLKQNPALANDLGITIDGTVDGAGGYNAIEKIVALFSKANATSGVHEILHHTERMLPAVVRAGVLKAYNAALSKAMKTATPEQQKAITQLIKDSSGLGGEGAADRMQQVFSDGTLNYTEHYQLANPSEFWAVNASKIFSGRQGKTGWRGKARAWLQSFVQKAKSILGLPNDNAVLQGLKSVLKADGSFVSNVMLAQDNARNLEPIFNDIPDGNRNAPPGTISTTGDQAAPRSREGFDELQRRIRSRTTLPAASPERALAQAMDRNQVTEPGQATRAIDARLQQLGEAFHDHLGPVERLFTDIGEGSPELRSSGERVVGAMRAAPGIRDNIMRQMIEDHGGNQLFSAIEQIARTQRLTLEDATGYLGYWLTAQRAPTANARLIARDTREVERTSRAHAQAESALNTARNTAGTPVGTLNQLEADTVGAARQLATATRQLALRTQAVNNPRASGVRRHVAGVAGFNNAQAASLAADIEQHIPREMLQQAAEHVYDLNAFRIVTDLESGRAPPEVVAQFLDNPDLQPLLQQLVEASRPDAQQEGSQANRDALRAQVMSAVRSNYVPLTGDPQTALYDESPGGGASQPNTGRTYMMEGRQDSMPDDGVTATMAGLIRSASHAGWAPFQDRVADIYEQMTPDQRNEFGIHRETRQVTDRSTGSNNSALIRLRGDTEQRFEFTDPKILNAIHNETIADTDASLSKFAKATKLYSWAATRFNLTFAPRNMMRDFGERADILLSKELRDEQGNKVPSPQVVKSMIYQGTVGLPKLLNAGVRYVLNGTAGGVSEASNYLRELQDSGNLSTFGQRFQNSRVDFIKQLKSAKTSNQRLRALNRYTLELWNTPFDFAAPLASYIAMRKNGVAKEQAQAVALELMNFRKRGTQMKTLGAAYPFAQTAVTGGVNMARSLVDTRNGKLKPYAVARLTGYVLTLSALRAMFMAAADDDEGGNKLAQLPDYEHENNIVIPTDNGIIKVPLPFGLMRLANGIVNNTLAYAGNEKSGRKAAGDLLMGTLIPSFAPISEAPLDGDKYPVQKFFATLAPPIFKPPLQVAMGLTPFGAPLKNEYAKEDKFISDQPKLNTPAAYTTMAQTIRQWTGVDVPPEAVRELVKGYPLGVVGYARSGLLEDKAVAEELRKPFYAPYPEAARYFQFKKAQDEASTELKKLQRGDNDYDPAKIKWLENYSKQEEKIQGQISSITKSKGLSDAAKAERKEELRTKRSAAQNEALYRWRTEIMKAEAKRTE